MSVSWTFDGTKAAVALGDGQVLLLDAASGHVLAALPRHADGAFHVACHPRQALVASSGQDGSVQLIDLEEALPPRRLPAGADWVEHLAWSPDGEWLAAGAGRHLLLWERATGTTRPVEPAASTVAGLHWSGDSRHLVIARNRGIDRIDPGTGAITETFEWPISFVSVALSPDGRWLVAGSQEKSVLVWELPFTPDTQMQMAGYPAKVRLLSWHAGSRFLATHAGNRIMAWDCSGAGPAGTTPRILEGHPDPVSALAYAGRGHLLASGSRDGRVVFWNPGKSCEPLRGFELGSEIQHLAWHPAQKAVLAGTRAGGVARLSPPGL